MSSRSSSGVALVTGASSGIGRDLAHVLAEHGHDLILTARSEEALRALADELAAKHGIRATVLTADLANPAAPRALYEAVRAGGFEVEILINNAGFGASGRFDQIGLQTQLDMLQVNVAALTALTHLFLPGMLARNYGRVMNVASTAAYQAGPRLAVYYASKAYVLSFNDAVADELRHTNVTLTALCPGPTRTNFGERANVGTLPLFSQKVTMASRPVAEQGYAGMMRGKRTVITGWTNKLSAFGTRLVPRRTAAMLARRLQEAR